MKVLITGGTGVIGAGLIPAFKLAGAERIRVLSRNAMRDVARWDDVEPYPADITDAAQVGESAEEMDLVVHVAGIESEHPPELTFDAINVHGTELVVSECERAGVRKLIYISTLGANDPATEYQRSKRRAEDIVRKFSRDWIILRPSGVYGPGDQHVSVLLQMIRSLPAVPLLGDGGQCIQPVWYEDFAAAVVKAAERDDLSHVTLSLGGHRITTANLVERLSGVTGRKPRLIRVPESIALEGTELVEAIGVDLPINSTQLRLLLQENCIKGAEANALIGTFGIEPIDLDESLRILADSLPEQTPDQGVGPLQRKIFQVEIGGVAPESLHAKLVDKLPELIPIPFAVEPGSAARIEEGATLTAELGARGTIQMRVEKVDPGEIVLVTVAGHPLAGAVRFLSENRAIGTLARIEVYARPSDLPHWLAMKAGSDAMQTGMWIETLRNIVQKSGGDPTGEIEVQEETLDDARETLADEWIRRIVDERQRETPPLSAR